MGIYNERPSYDRREIKDKLRRDTGSIPRTGGKKYYEPERIKLEKLIGRQYGEDISKDEFKKTIRSLRTERRKSQDSKERKELGKKIDYLERFGGLKH